MITNVDATPWAGTLLHALIEAHAQRTPDADAVMFQHVRLSYRELDDRANRLACALQQTYQEEFATQLPPNTLIGVCLPPSAEVVVALLGILKAGGVVVFLDASAPPERLATLRDDAGLSLIVSTQALFPRVASPAVYLLDMAALLPFPAHPAPPRNPTEPTESPLAFCLYTSGSTGKPKGVLLDHSALVQHCQTLADYYRLRPTDRFLQFAPMAHVAGLEPVLISLLAGACVVLREETVWTPTEFLTKVEEYQLTVIDIPVDYCHMVLKSWLKTPEQVRTTSLRIIIVGGDVTLPSVVQWWQQSALPSIRLINVYGMTETSGTVTAYDIPHQSDQPIQRVPIGKPLAGRTVSLLDDQLQPVPDGSTGELFVAGNLARGYLNHPVWTSERFVEHPSGQEHHARMYKTGDLARILPSGDLEFLGRSDHQVQVRGYRTELGEVEAVLSQRADIHEVVVVAHGEQLHKQLVAYVVLTPDTLVPNAPSGLELPDRHRGEEGVLQDLLERIAFKLRQVNLRSERTASDVVLPKPAHDASVTQAYLSRQSYRYFQRERLSFSHFSAFLSCLLQWQPATLPLPKYRYPSTGGLYPVQTYLSIKPDAIEGIAEGVYYYHPADHRLIPLGAHSVIDPELYLPTQVLATQCAFALFLVAHMDAIVPMYGTTSSWELSLLEAGYMGQLLMTEAPTHHIGLCPIANVGTSTAELQSLLGLEAHHIPIHSFLGGRITAEQTRQWLQPAPNKTTAEEWKKQVRREVAQQLPSYMVPQTWVILDALPRTSSGKVDRQALPPPDPLLFDDPLLSLDDEQEQDLAAMEDLRSPFLQEGPNPPQSPSSTSSPLRERLAQARPGERRSILAQHVRQQMGKALGRRADLSLDEGFFDLGMNSLMVVELRNALQQSLACKLPATLTFDYPTGTSMVDYLIREALPDLFEPQAPETSNDLLHEQDERESVQSKAIAIISMAVRFPGADSTEALWTLLQSGCDAIRTVPPDRWNIDEYYDPDPDAPGKMVTRMGGFLNHIDRFDADFFKLSPREAQMLDPQHRLLLELSWEALERALLDPTHLPRLTGIFVGISGSDYNALLCQSQLEQDSLYRDTGNASSTASGRLAHFFNVQGPTYAIDTACSSSLVAIHLAVQSLRLGECQLALAGGVNCLLDPQGYVSASKGRLLAPDGYCKTFDASANGYARSEGCGIVVLKRLSDAQRDGDPILAVIRGSAVNHDGQTSGLTVPSGPSQQAVVRAALTNARLQPDDIGYVEAHGTGTPLGDPIEINALSSVFANRDTPLYLGSIKTNMGHLEAAAGVAGLCKVVLALQHKEIPPHLHFQTPNPNMDWESLPIQVTTTHTPCPTGKAAGVSSFGFSGTNAHVILEAAPEQQGSGVGGQGSGPERESDVPSLLTLSAASSAALDAMVQCYADYLAAHPNLVLADVCHTAATRRSHFAHRLALVASDIATAQQQLAALAVGNTKGVVTGIAERTKTPKVAFLFTGHGAQYVGMGRQLYATQPVFREALEVCAAKLTAYLDRPLLEVLYPADGNPAPLLDTMTYSQPAIFAVAYALACLWQAWGIRPAVVLGHSIGEYVAACVAGVFSLDDGLKLVAARGRLMDAAPDSGMMATIFASEDTVRDLVAPYPAEVTLAAINAPTRIVISGTRNRVEEILHTCTQQGIEVRRLQVAQAGHSPLLDPILDDFEAVAQSVTYHEPIIPLVAGLTGQLAAATEMSTARYWRRHLRKPVPFTTMLHTLAAQNITAYLEIGSHPMLVSLGQQTLPDVEKTIWVASLHRERDDWQHLLTSLGQLYVHGAPVEWGALYPPAQHQRVPLPTYPFQRQRYWLTPSAQRARSTLHPLLDTIVRSPLIGGTLCTTEISAATLPWLEDHQVFGRIVMPGAGSIVLVLSAATLLWETAAVEVQDIVLAHPLVIPDNQPCQVHLLLQPATPSNGTPTATARLVSLTPDAPTDAEPLVHLTGMVGRTQASTRMDSDLATWQARCPTPVPLAPPSDNDLVLGPTFQWLSAVWRGEHEALARLEQPAALESTHGYALHPALLDACFQLTDYTGSPTLETLLPFAIEQVSLRAPAHPGSTWWVHARQTGERRWDLTLLNAEGQVVVAVTGYQERPATASAVLAQQQYDSWLYRVVWRAQSLVPQTTTATGRWLILASDGNLGASLVAQLQQHGQTAVVIHVGREPNGVVQDGQAVNLADPVAVKQTLVPLLTVDKHPCQAVIYLATQPDDPTRLSIQAQDSYSGALHLAQTLVQHTATSPRLWLVTRGTQSVIEHEALQVSGAPLWGLGRSIQYEHPDLQTTLLDLPATPDPNEATWLAQEVLTASAEPQVAYRAGQRAVARLVRDRPQPQPPQTLPIHSHASYLITGGLGGLGLVIARALVEQGARHLVLSGRRGITSDIARQTIAALEQQGATVRVVPADVAQATDMQQLIAACESLSPLRGIVHAAGVLDDGVLVQQTPARYQTVAAPKVAGAWHLHTLTRHIPLDFCVYCSSVAALLGDSGQANYAAANAFLDSLAQQRVSQGLPALSINWGAWTEVGLAAERARTGRITLERQTSLTPQEGQAVFLRLLTQPGGQIAVIPGLSHLGRTEPFFQELMNGGTRPAAPRVEIRQRLAEAPQAEQTTLLEHYLRTELARILRLPSAADLATHTHFFNLGMDSLMGVELRNKIRTDLGYMLPATLVFDYPTLDALTTYLVTLTRDSEQTALEVPLVRVDRSHPLPLSLAQERLWFNQTTNRAHSYVIVVSHRLVGPLDITALAHSLDVLVQRHEVLRTIFPLVNGIPQQVITTPEPITLVPLDIQDLAETEQNATIEHLIRREVDHVHDLATGPLMRFVLVKQAADCHVLIIAFNHILLDAGSVGQFLDELGRVYTSVITGVAAALPDLPFQYADYATWQRQTMTPALIETRLHYWLQRFQRETPLFELDHDKPRPATETFRGDILPYSATHEQTRQLRALQHGTGTTLFSKVLAAWTALLSRYGVGEELVVASPFANRPHRDLSNVIGHWGSMLILPLTFQPDMTFRDLIEQIIQATRIAMDNEVPFAQLVEALPVSRKRNNLPHQVFLSFLPEAADFTLQMANLTATQIERKTGMVRPDISFFVGEEKTPDGLQLRGQWVYKLELFERESIVRMMEDFHQLIDAVIADPSLPIREIPLLHREMSL